MSKLIAFAGLPGTGKTTLARLLAMRLGAVLLNKDDVRGALFAPKEVEYSGRQNDFCMDVIYQLAQYHAERQPKRAIIVDGRTFSKRHQVEALAACAAACRRPLAVIECVCSEATAVQRLQDDVGKHVALDRDASLYQQVKASWEEILVPKLVVETEGVGHRELIGRIVEYVTTDLPNKVELHG